MRRIGEKKTSLKKRDIDITDKRWKYAAGPLESRLRERIQQKYMPLIQKIKMPPANLDRISKREDVVKQLEGLGLKDKYTAYAIASRIIKK